MITKLVPDKEVIDLGDIKFGTVQKFTYNLSNVSDNALIVMGIVAGCKSCTVAQLAGKARIGPGETRPLHVTFSAGDLGKALKGISILHKYPGEDDPQELKLLFKAQIHE